MTITNDVVRLAREWADEEASRMEKPMLRACEVCDGPGPCLYDYAPGRASTHRYACRKCHSRPEASFFARSHVGTNPARRLWAAVCALPDEPVTLWRYVMPPEPQDRFSGWGFFLLDSAGMMACVTDYGNYAHKWDAIGDRDFRSFLCGCEQDYLAGKLDSSMHYNGDATRKEIRRTICELRREAQLTRDVARTEWDLVDEYDGVYSEVDFADWHRNTTFSDAYELAVYRSSASIVAFCERLWPRLVVLLKEQLKKEYPNVS